MGPNFRLWYQYQCAYADSMSVVAKCSYSFYECMVSIHMVFIYPVEVLFKIAYLPCDSCNFLCYIFLRDVHCLGQYVYQFSFLDRLPPYREI